MDTVMPKGRPIQDPRGRKRVKLQPWVSPDTAFALRWQASQAKTTIGHMLDQWLKDRAGQVSKVSATLTKRLSDTPITEEDLDDNGDPIL
jgi:hypothetical protein